MFCGPHMVAWKAQMCQSHRKVRVLYSACTSSSLSTLFVYRIGCHRHQHIPLLPHRSKAGGRGGCYSSKSVWDSHILRFCIFGQRLRWWIRVSVHHCFCVTRILFLLLFLLSTKSDLCALLHSLESRSSWKPPEEERKRQKTGVKLSCRETRWIGLEHDLKHIACSSRNCRHFSTKVQKNEIAHELLISSSSGGCGHVMPLPSTMSSLRSRLAKPCCLITILHFPSRTVGSTGRALPASYRMIGLAHWTCCATCSYHLAP